ncbi:sulfite exporter TauE/SafE family protein [Phenylobacterium soli]|uniref:Probable membrane transporter protein n=1 Tax=Phenylobacterium soli TaxID=2170551 RepID=A0A328AM85_9CAUL|nr:sulfite exporter TauE/SafE family protein [Phenylobacterium soli]RAK54534.1 sulfite exporter TauE/SafE family protein [Phenylobacterium soli]
MLFLLFGVAVWAGAQNALAGGGSFVTLPALILSGLDARAANIASTLALFPGQVTTGWVGRKLVSGVAGLSFKALVAISLAGGAVGAVLLLLTPSSFFAHLVPWLVLFATGLFAYGSFFRKPTEHGPRLSRASAGVIQFMISVYGGYFGGGIGFLMLAALTAAGLAVRQAGSTKNVLASIMNAAAVAIFLFTPGIPWLRVGVVAAGAMAGGYLGALALKRVDERIIRGFVVLLGIALTIGLFLRQRG